MTALRPAADASAADWLLAAEVPWSELVRFGPPGFETYLRVAFAQTPDRATDTADTHRTTIALLAEQTPSTIGHAAVREGWTSGDPARTVSEIDIPNRRMLLFTGPVLVLRDAPALAWQKPGELAEPALVWPADRSWCVACDVDEEVEFSVGCSAVAAAFLSRQLPGQTRPVPYGDAGT